MEWDLIKSKSLITFVMSAFPLIELENNLNQPNSKDHNPKVGCSNLPPATKPSLLGLNQRLLYLNKKNYNETHAT